MRYQGYNIRHASLPNMRIGKGIIENTSEINLSSVVSILCTAFLLNTFDIFTCTLLINRIKIIRE